jgi:2-polyprenyl-6-methoxyphenol hydroxylase-like FAD-dependent oxidoreductase
MACSPPQRGAPDAAANHKEPFVDNRTDPHPTRVGGSAVVIGASMAGLCAARVLADRFDHVTVLDRDGLPDTPTWRQQVPQGRHPHLLLAAGARLLEGWFPGIIDELYVGGAVEVDLSADLYWHQGGGVARRPPSSLKGPSMSRPFLEWTVRQRLASHPTITIRGDTAVEGLDLDPTRTRVVAVRLQDGDPVLCDLVVDATGRQARSLSWLSALGYPEPKVSRVEVDTRYLTQELRRTEAPHRDWKVAGVIDDPATKRLAMALPVEGDRWLLLFGGVHGETAPTGDDQRLEYARTLPSPVIADILEASEPLGEPVTHRFPSSQRRHVERLKRFPLGWVLLGDAIGSFNPIYGQGMTAAAQQAAALDAALDRSGAIDRSFARQYFKAASRIVNTAWSTAVGGDSAYAETKGPKPPGTTLINRYMDRVIVAAQHDDTVALRFNEVVAMVRRPESLMAPRFMLRVRRASRRKSRLASDATPLTEATR